MIVQLAFPAFRVRPLYSVFFFSFMIWTSFELGPIARFAGGHSTNAIVCLVSDPVATVPVL